MTNVDRQKSIERSIIKQFGKFICDRKLFCYYCHKEKENACAKAYNRMNYYPKQKSGCTRERYSWTD